jgi:hypothetical protein
VEMVSVAGCFSLCFILIIYFLRRHSWCAIGEGSFLNVAVHRFSLERAARKVANVSDGSEISLDDVEYHLEQCFRCLYDVSKCKNRYFQHHKCNQVCLLEIFSSVD